MCGRSEQPTRVPIQQPQPKLYLWACTHRPWWERSIPGSAPRPPKEARDPDARPLLQAVTELLTTGKLSELALLTLYLMYEKKRGRQSVWQPFIQALDRQRGRGQQGAKSPLLWDPGQAERLLAGSPVLADLHARLVVRMLLVVYRVCTACQGLP